MSSICLYRSLTNITLTRDKPRKYLKNLKHAHTCFFDETNKEVDLRRPVKAGLIENWHACLFEEIVLHRHLHTYVQARRNICRGERNMR